jgi:GH15 family glucan-1,4-alpha-glucosidase
LQGTISAVGRNLLEDGLVMRYRPEHATDGLPGNEGAFLACSFWLVDAYAYSGRTKDSEALFERLLSLRNDLGLLSEEYEPSSRRLVGNFPQAFSHLALVHSASVLAAKPQDTRGDDHRDASEPSHPSTG